MRRCSGRLSLRVVDGITSQTLWGGEGEKAKLMKQVSIIIIDEYDPVFD